MLGNDGVVSVTVWENDGPRAIMVKLLKTPYLKDTVDCGVSKLIVDPDRALNSATLGAEGLIATGVRLVPLVKIVKLPGVK